MRVTVSVARTPGGPRWKVVQRPSVARGPDKTVLDVVAQGSLEGWGSHALLRLAKRDVISISPQSVCRGVRLCVNGERVWSWRRESDPSSRDVFLRIAACRDLAVGVLAMPEGRTEPGELIPFDFVTETAKEIELLIEVAPFVPDETWLEWTEEDGIRTHWYSPDAPAARGAMVEGRRHGLWKFWRASGLLREQETYEHGVLHGPCAAWDHAGRLRALGQLHAGHLHGEWIYWEDETDNAVIWTYKSGAPSRAPRRGPHLRPDVEST